MPSAVCETGTDGLLNNFPTSQVIPLLTSSIRKKMEATNFEKNHATIRAKL
jgi:hypothetical protein